MRLSVIIPAFNAQAYIGRCLDSIASQALPPDDYEVLVVDDGSSSESFRELATICSHFACVRLLRSDRRGPGGARNVGTAAAKGDYIWYVDADDYIVSGCLPRLLDLMQERRLDLMTLDFVRRPADFVGVEPRLNTSVQPDEPMCGPDYAVRHNYGAEAWRLIFSSALVADGGLLFDEKRLCADSIYVTRLILRSSRTAHLAVPAYIYTFNPESVTNRGSSAHLQKVADDMTFAALSLRRLAFESPVVASNPELQRRVLMRSEALVFFLLFRLLRKQAPAALMASTHMNLQAHGLLPLRLFGAPEYPGIGYVVGRTLVQGATRYAWLGRAARAWRSLSRS